MQRVKRYLCGISPRTRFLIVYFLVMGFGGATFTRLANTINAVALLPIEMVMAAIAYRRDGLRRDAPMLFGIMAIIWGMMASALNGTLLEESRAISYWGMAGAWFFMLRTPQSRDAKSLKDEFSAICTVYLISYLPLVLIALTSLFTGIAMKIPGDNNYPVGIVATGDLVSRFRVMDNANHCARTEMLCVLFAIYLFINRKKIGWRIFSAFSGITNLMVLAHTQSRSGAIALSLGIGLIAFRCAYVLIRKKGWRIVAGGAACVLVFFIVLNGINYIYKADVAVARHTAMFVDEDALKVTTHLEGGGQFDVSSTGRTEMWKRIGQYLIAHPKALLTGVTGGNVMDVVDEGTGITRGMGNTHNAYIACVTSCGLPFLLIVLAFLVYMVPKCWKVLTGPCDHGEFIFVAIIVALLAANLSEVGLFANLKGDNSLFMLICGYVLHHCRSQKAA